MLCVCSLINTHIVQEILDATSGNTTDSVDDVQVSKCVRINGRTSFTLLSAYHEDTSKIGESSDMEVQRNHHSARLQGAAGTQGVPGRAQEDLRTFWCCVCAHKDVRHAVVAICQSTGAARDPAVSGKPIADFGTASAASSKGTSPSPPS